MLYDSARSGRGEYTSTTLDSAPAAMPGGCRTSEELSGPKAWVPGACRLLHRKSYVPLVIHDSRLSSRVILSPSRNLSWKRWSTPNCR